MSFFINGTLLNTTIFRGALEGIKLHPKLSYNSCGWPLPPCCYMNRALYCPGHFCSQEAKSFHILGNTQFFFCIGLVLCITVSFSLSFSPLLFLPPSFFPHFLPLPSLCSLSLSFYFGTHCTFLFLRLAY